ncbi:hypothetical protein CTI12_AA438890 [Artemisia annua]|uniref:KIB1-4 beta-propeller domain-containing protein n=1 Tax=Artemisia annua TaxID=35608 RepID=A0A2U1LYJ0_ARTAN|nr:hypothetical protein CTI12_AA438890 [Artemisia annua]
MEQKQIFCGEQFPPLSIKHPWLVSQKAEEDDIEDQIFYTINDPLTQYRCRIPEWVGRYIDGCLHGWVILYDYPHEVMWSLWNPVTREIIHLPPLILKNGKPGVLEDCCLSHAPDHPSSIIFFTRRDEQTIVFCRLAGHQENKLTWTDMSYMEQLKNIINDVDDEFYLHCPTCCNGKVYALSKYNVIEVDIMVNDTEVVINLLPFTGLPYLQFLGICSYNHVLKGYGRDLFYILIEFDEIEKLRVVYIYKMNMTSMMWEEMEDLKDAIFFIELRDDKAFYSNYMPNIASELGGYIHILDQMGKVMYSTNVKDKTISISAMPCAVPKRYLSLWECSFPGDHRELFSKQEKKKDESPESHLLNIPLDVLGKIIEFCVGIEFLNFRAACKSCLLAAPMIRWDNGNGLKTYSSVSPWLMVFNKHRGIISFTDPMFGDKYFIKTPQKLIGDLRIHYSKYGWLLIEKYEPTNEQNSFVFFNPFTGDIRELPVGGAVPMPFASSFCFSAPPTSPNCMVFGPGNYDDSSWGIYIRRVSSKRPGYIIVFDNGDAGCDPSLRYPAFNGEDLYALLADGRLFLLEKIEDTDSSSRHVLVKSPRSCRGPSTRYFLVKCDQHVLLVIMCEFGESIEVFKFNDFTKEWEEINSLGRHIIIISDNTCLSIEAKMREMENKIYFSRLHSESEKIVFYSLETGRYHTSNDKNIKESFEDFFGTKYHLYPHTWIEPSWS